MRLHLRNYARTMSCVGGGACSERTEAGVPLLNRLASYFLYLKNKPKQIPESSRDGLFLLGLLPSREFFDRPTPAQLSRNLNANRQLINRIEILNNADRDRLNRSVEAATSANRPRFQATLGKIFKYNRSGTDVDRSSLLAEEVHELFESKKSASTSKASKVIPIERAGVDAILQGDEKELAQLEESSVKPSMPSRRMKRRT